MVKFREISLTSPCELPHLPAGHHGDGGGVAVGVAENAPYVNLVQWRAIRKIDDHNNPIELRGHVLLSIWLVESVDSYHLISIKLALDCHAHLSNSGVHNRDGNLGLSETDQDQAASGFSGKYPEPFKHC